MATTRTAKDMKCEDELCNEKQKMEGKDMSEAYNLLDEVSEERYRIETDESAEHHIQKIRQKLAEIQMWGDFYDMEFAKIKEDKYRDIDFSKSLLQEYFARIPHKATKTQESYALPSGKMVMKMQQPKYTVDDAALVPWLEESAPDLVKVEKKANWAELKKQVTVSDGNVVDNATGEVIPGVTVTHRDPVFEVVLNA